MTKAIKNTFGVLFLVTITISFCMLFEIGGTENTTSQDYAKGFALAFVESCVFFLVYLKANNKK